MNIYILLIFNLGFFLNTPYKEFLCKYTETSVMIDADLEEWRNASSIQIRDEKGKTDNKVKIYSLWDEENLYFAFDVKDSNLEAKQTEQDHAKLFLDDMIEFLIDPRNDKDSCWALDDIIYHINILGQKKDDRGTISCLTDPVWNGDARYATRINGSVNDPSDVDIGYVIEISIPWHEMKIKPSAGRLIGANFGNGDNGTLFDWVDASPFRSPYAFGNLVLVGRK